MQNEMTGYIYITNKTERTPLHCLRCGNMLMVIKGRIYYYTVGEKFPYKDVALTEDYITHICHRCRFKINLLITHKSSILPNESGEQL